MVKIYEYDVVALASYLSCDDSRQRMRRIIDAEHRLTQWLLAMGAFDGDVVTQEVVYGHALLAHVRRERQALYGPAVIFSGPYSLSSEAV